MSNPAADPIWKALAAEAGVAADQIGHGVTLIPKMTALYGHSFSRVMFPLSIGMERACKLLLQVDSRLETGAFRTEKEMRNLGHRLDGLLSAVDEVGRRRGAGDAMPTSDIQRGMVSVLTEFATGGRYHNLDLVAGKSGSVDPGQRWWAEVVIPILDIHWSAAKRQEAEARGRHFGAMMDQFTMVLHEHVDGGSVDSYGHGFMVAEQIEVAAPWMRMYVLQFARWLNSVAWQLAIGGGQAHAEIPHLPEFFGMFNNSDDYFRKHRKWRPEY